MILQIFHIRKTIKDIKEARSNPSGFAVGQGKDFFLGLAIPILLPGTVLTIISFIFAFTSLLGGPYVAAKVFFWIFLIPTVVIFLVLRKIFGLVNKLKNKQRDINVSAVYDKDGKRVD